MYSTSVLTCLKGSFLIRQKLQECCHVRNDRFTRLDIAVAFEIAKDWTQPQCLFTGRHKEIIASSNGVLCSHSKGDKGLGADADKPLNGSTGGGAVSRPLCETQEMLLSSGQPQEAAPLGWMCWHGHCLLSVLCAFSHPQGTGVESLPNPDSRRLVRAAFPPQLPECHQAWLPMHLRWPKCRHYILCRKSDRLN